MSQNAISAQGSTVHIATGTGGAKTITAITKALNAEVTSALHGLVVGDRVTFAAVVGMTEINALVGTVIDSGTNTFCVNIDSRTFTTYTSGGTATPVTWTEILDITDFNPSGSSAAEIPVTDLKSTAVEVKSGLRDNGTFGLNINVVPTDPGQVAVKAKYAASTNATFKLTTPDAKVYTFLAAVKSFPEIPDGATNGILTGTIDLRVSGAVTVA